MFMFLLLEVNDSVHSVDYCWMCVFELLKHLKIARSSQCLLQMENTQYITHVTEHFISVNHLYTHDPQYTCPTATIPGH